MPICAVISHLATGMARERTLEFFIGIGIFLALGAILLLIRYLRRQRLRTS